MADSKARTAAYRKAHPERAKAAVIVWRKANPETAKAASAAWKAANPKRVKEGAVAWRRSNPEKRIEQHHIRRARKYGTGFEPVTKAHLKLLFEAQDGCCRYCRTPLGKDKHLDHRIPLARGGSHSPSNVCWSCPSCNLKKNTKTEQEFLNG